MHPVILYPLGIKPVVLDLSGADAESEFGKEIYSIGRYNEKRAIYSAEQYLSEDGPRCIHLGIDFGAPVGTPVYLPCAGEVAFVGYNGVHLDYGYTLITKHKDGDNSIFFLFGHLGADVLSVCTVGQRLEEGAVIGRVGSYEENGHWPPHLHFQLSYRVPTTHDLPGVCTEKDRETLLLEFPDPRIVLGPVY